METEGLLLGAQSNKAFEQGQWFKHLQQDFCEDHKFSQATESMPQSLRSRAHSQGRANVLKPH